MCVPQQPGPKLKLKCILIHLVVIYMNKVKQIRCSIFPRCVSAFCMLRACSASWHPSYCPFLCAAGKKGFEGEGGAGCRPDRNIEPQTTDSREHTKGPS